MCRLGNMRYEPKHGEKSIEVKKTTYIVGGEGVINLRDLGPLPKYLIVIERDSLCAASYFLVLF